MFTTQTSPDHILIPLDSLSVLHPDLSLWLKHSLSICKPNVYFAARKKHIVVEDHGADSLAYNVASPSSGKGFHVVIGKQDLKIQYGYGYDRYKRDIGAGFADMVIYFDAQTSTQDYLIANDIKFSDSIVGAIQKHFSTTDDINAKPLPERMLYFMFTALVAQSKNVMPTGDNAFTNLLACLDHFGARLENATRQHGKTTTEAFFSMTKVDNVDCLVFSPKLADGLLAFAAQTVEEIVPGSTPLITPPERKTGAKQLAIAAPLVAKF